MAASRNIAKSKNKDIFSKKVPSNPKYNHVKATLDTGASITNYMKKIDEIRKNYRFRKDEIFKRMKVSTFAQLVLQVAEVVNLELERQYIESARSHADENGNDEESFDEESLHDKSADRANLENLINGLGEVELTNENTVDDELKINLDNNREQHELTVPEATSLPFLLLDVRDKDLFKECHIIGALNYPSTMLTRSVNYLSSEMLAVKNKAGKIIIVYDDDEKVATHVATVLVQRDIDNVIMLSGGMKVLNKKFPGCFMSGTLPSTCFSPPAERKGKKPKPLRAVTENVGVEWYTPELLENIQDKLDTVLLDNESSRMSSRASTKASTRTAMSSVRTTRSAANSSAAWK